AEQVEVDALRPVDDHLEQRPGHLEVVEVEPAVGQEGQDQLTNPVGHGHLRYLLSYERRGPQAHAFARLLRTVTASTREEWTLEYSRRAGDHRPRAGAAQ